MKKEDKSKKAFQCAWWVIEVILSCKTHDHLKGAINCIRAYKTMFPDEFWRYDEEFENAMAEQQEIIEC